VNVADAAYRTVHDYPGGSASLAPRLGMKQAVLNSKVNPHTTTHHLTLAEASLLMGMTNDFRMLHALNAEHGHVAQLAEAAPDSGGLLGTVLRANAAEGNFDRILEEALADNLITPNEFKLVADAGLKSMEALQALVARIRAASEQGGAPA
jgi:hypothetical protein